MPPFRDYLAGADRTQYVTRANESELLTDDLTNGFLYAVVLEYRPGLTHVVELAYDVRQPWSNPNAGRTEQFLIALGALPRPLRLADLGIGRALSTHVELVAPADTDIVSARINVEQYDTATDSLEKRDKPADKLSRSRAQFHLPLRAGSEIVDESSEANRMRRERQLRGRTDLGSVFVTLLPRPSVVLAPISISALLAGSAPHQGSRHVDHEPGGRAWAVFSGLRSGVAPTACRRTLLVWQPGVSSSSTCGSSCRRSCQ